MSAGRKGFTLVEMIVTCLIVGILTAFGLARYTKNLEYNKAKDAAGVMIMVGTANRMYALAHNNTYLTGKLTNPGCAAYGTACLGTGNNVCDLIACGYLAQNDWDSMPYEIAALANETACPMVGSNTTPMVACAKRRGGGPWNPPYSAWGYYMYSDGRFMCFWDTGGCICPTGSVPDCNSRSPPKPY